MANLSHEIAEKRKQERLRQKRMKPDGSTYSGPTLDGKPAPWLKNAPKPKNRKTIA
jgi:hypothetical protein